MKRTLDQLRAEDAWNRAKAIHSVDLGADGPKLYRSYVDALGATILMNGLGQALATEAAAGGSNPGSDRERAHRRLLDNVQQWLCRSEGGVYPGTEDVLVAIMENDQNKYLHAQAETLAWLEWHKKFCRSMLPKGQGDDDQ